MSLATTICRASVGLESPQVSVEVHLAGGLPGFCLVGVPETAVRESKDRVRSALINSGFEFPARRITVNLAPANVPKEGGRFDLSIAVGILAASGQVSADRLSDYELYGELSLGGNLRTISGALAVTVAAQASGRCIIMPSQNAATAARVAGVKIASAHTLIEVAAMLDGKQMLPAPAPPEAWQETRHLVDLADIRGQPMACRALEIAAAGGHHLLMVGPPGSGKTMIARRLPTILPPLSREESLQSATLYDVANTKRSPEAWNLPVFRNPHHTLSMVALVGGGRVPLPGEISLAHCGVLFLDELAEIPRQTLEVLRQPLEEQHVNISRAAGRVSFPCRFQLVAAMNPCPCGYAGDTQRECRCAPGQISRYHHKISGPLLDRIDIHLRVPRPATSVLAGAGPTGSSSNEVRQRVQAARDRQDQRGLLNSDLSSRQLTNSKLFGADARHLLRSVAEKKGVSARAWFRAMKVALTIADMAQEAVVDKEHMAEALQLRFVEL